ncbi:MAG: hypothetical protein Unbinned5089contig1000_35 [Prokaryotic dsDNA virus sp.]|nr:MAG: hypothetical protein Unbinned5089contig1000_35 [Prokaryotic dsDNA virus sp.]|tara:strand:- start:2078 stop:2266 length:189 start_codon:yes stop_codon:yes gene_type:complete
MYLDRQECYDDILHSLRLGVLSSSDIIYLRKFYEDTENYECCQGLIDACEVFKREVNGIKTN